MVNPALIPPKALGSGLPASYEYFDAAALRGQLYYYFLKAVGIDLHQQFGPQAALAQFGAFCPLLRR